MHCPSKLVFWPHLLLQSNFLEFRVWSNLQPLEKLVKVVVFLTMAPWANMFNAKSLATVSIETIRFADKHLIILTTPNKHCADLILCSHLQRCVNFVKITGLHAFTTEAKLQEICTHICIVCKDSSKKKIWVHIWTFCKWSLNSWPHIILAQRCKSYANVTFTG